MKSPLRQATATTVGVLCVLLMRAPILVASGRAVSFTSADGTPLAGLLYEAAHRPAPGVILVHMLGKSKEEWAHLADRLQDAGATVLAIDLRGHGSAGGSAAVLPPMVADVRAAIDWLNGRPGVRAAGLAVVGASLGANLAALASADAPQVRAIALLSPSLDYRGLRLDAGVIKKIGGRAIWLAASTSDPYSLRTIRELAAAGATVEQHLGTARGHGTQILVGDPDLARALVDWLARTLIF